MIATCLGSELQDIARHLSIGESILHTYKICGYRLVVRTSRCGRENLGSNPSTVMFLLELPQRVFCDLQIFRLIIFKQTHLNS